MCGYRRFADDHGLCHLDRSDDFAPEERTRHGNGEVCVRASFALEDGDRAELSTVKGAEAIRQFRVWKREGPHRCRLRRRVMKR